MRNVEENQQTGQMNNEMKQIVLDMLDGYESACKKSCDRETLLPGTMQRLQAVYRLSNAVAVSGC